MSVCVIAVINTSCIITLIPHTTSAQVGFFSGICLPCYDLLAKLVPELTPMLENCADNLASWKQLAEQRKLEAQDETEI